MREVEANNLLTAQIIIRLCLGGDIRAETMTAPDDARKPIKKDQKAEKKSPGVAPEPPANTDNTDDSDIESISPAPPVTPAIEHRKRKQGAFRPETVMLEVLAAAIELASLSKAKHKRYIVQAKFHHSISP